MTFRRRLCHGITQFLWFYRVGVNLGSKKWSVGVQYLAARTRRKNKMIFLSLQSHFMVIQGKRWSKQHGRGSPSQVPQGRVGLPAKTLLSLLYILRLKILLARILHLCQARSRRCASKIRRRNQNATNRLHDSFSLTYKHPTIAA